MHSFSLNIFLAISVCLVCHLSAVHFFSKQIPLVAQQLLFTSFLLTLFVLIYYLDTDLDSDRRSFLHIVFLWFQGFWIENFVHLSAIDVCHSNILNHSNLKILFKCFSYCVEMNIFLCRQIWGGQHVSHITCLC